VNYDGSWVGAVGPLSFNQWHNNAVPWAGYTYNGKGTAVNDLVANAGTLSLNQIGHVELLAR
jgi:hypothetical protein